MLSLPADVYEEMVTTMKLPFCCTESSSVVGPFYWFGHGSDPDSQYLR